MVCTAVEYNVFDTVYNCTLAAFFETTINEFEFQIPEFD